MIPPIRPRLVLVGPPGAGKTTVGQLVAARLGVDFLDTDAAIESADGKPVSEIFLDSGEEHFRAAERVAVARALAEHPGVLALGGGALLAEDTRTALAGHVVVYLRTGFAAAARRVGFNRDRPLLLGNPRGQLRALLAEREPVYAAAATHIVPTDDRTPDEVAGAVLEAMGAGTAEREDVAVLTVGAGPNCYDVLVGRDLTGAVGPLLAGAERVAVIHPPTLAARAATVAAAMQGASVRTTRIEVPDGEAAKTLPVAGRCFDELGTAGFTRSDAIVAVGGGAVTDLGGFVAATWLRGVRVVHLPTTLLGMVDAAIGGKTGVNTAAGKNLVGAFHPPVGVVCDLDALDTLPAAEYRPGLAEVVKAGFIADPSILELIEADPAAATEPRSPVTAELVVRAIAVKAVVVSRDLRESGEREYLNYGHTLAHAIERREKYQWRHGNAVAVGLVYAAALGRLAGHLDAPTADRHRRILGSLGLPTRYRGGLEAWSQLRASMGIDKKSRGSTLRFVVLGGLAAPTILGGPGEELLEAAYREVSA